MPRTIKFVIFLQDGRKISVGDCALFKPPQDSPPFIGLIRWLTSRKDNNLHLGVNWLYRPAELKLGKGSLLDSAPNEIFYSFHKDEIPAASVLHPCKVAFLPRGAELPTGTSSFVCRRVYDIENKCLWWLTDQDYINELQEEVDQLLYKTRSEMHGMLQPGGRSPKQVNGPNSLSQLKPGSDHVQNSGTSFPSQVKGKKRERGDHTADPVKRDRSSRTEDGDSAQYKAESSLKSDIARITEKGGVVDLEGVERLIQLMQSDRAEKQTDLTSRLMLAGVIAATEKVECLQRFVQLRGLPVLDEWLQDIHKGKVGSVNLHALQMCNIGRSVNHLRSNKNVEIQRKARSLVDTWKKGVEAEMISIDAKSGSTQGTSVWSSKSRLTEASYAVKTPSGSDVAMKSSITQQSASKTNSIKSSHGENITKSASSSPGPVKPASPHTYGKESQPGISVGGSPDAPITREDRSNSSNQSHSYSQSISVKEEGRSSTAVSAIAGKMSSSSRNRKGSGFPAVNAVQKENSSSRSSFAHRSTASDKLSQSALTSERVREGPSSEACNHKLVVKIPNLVRSPTQGVSGLEDPSIMSSRTSSPGLSDKVEQFDTIQKEKSDAYRSDINVDSCQSNDRKDASRDGAASPAGLPDDEKNPNWFHQLIQQKEAPLQSRKSPLVQKSKSSPDDQVQGCQSQFVNDAESDDKKQAALDGSSGSEDGSNLPKQASLVCPADIICGPAHTSADLPVKERNKPLDSVSTYLRSTIDPVFPATEMSNQNTDTNDKISGGDGNKGIQEEKAPPNNVSADSILNCKGDGTSAADTEDKAGKDLLDTGNVNLMVKDALLNQSCVEDCKNDVNEGVEIGTNSQQKFTAAGKASNEKLQQTAPVQSIASEASDEVKVREMDEMDSKTPTTNAERENFEIADRSLPEGGFPVPVVHEAQKNDELRGTKGAGVEVDEAESASTVGEASSAAPASAQDSKIKFDLNEGLIFDDGKYGEPLRVYASSQLGGLDLDLNRVDEATETGQCSTSSNRIGEGSMLHVKPLSGLPTSDVQRDFDLNDGPGVDDASMEHLSINQQVRVHIPSQLPSASPRMSNPGLGSFTSWFPPGYTNSTVAIPSIIPDRADQPFPVIPWSTTENIWPCCFPLPSATFPVGATSYADSSSGAKLFAPVNSQLLGSVGAISSQFQRPYMVSLPDSSSNGGLENNRKWGRQGLDLNAGPGAVESEVREDMLPPPSSQHSVASSQALTEDQARMYSMSGKSSMFPVDNPVSMTLYRICGSRSELDICL
ncbi:UNVERIFIED_CONTAM: hypothetical protein Sradi_0025800 [Sesamum radiatum]|uniref:Uncharacterized protein n=1 Tax=Sesamum radiatum TaxID=300843 RepID=A0AAW2WGB1_SESRA